MKKIDFFEKKNRTYANYNIVQKRYAKEDIIIRKAYIFAVELLMSPIQVGGDYIIYNEFRTSAFDSMGESRLKKKQNIF